MTIARQPSMVWTERSKRTTAQLAEARRLEATGRRADARRAQALCWAVAVAHDDMARRWAERWGSRAVPIEDRRQTARIGLYRSALRYDPARGVPFSGHARWWVMATLTRSHPEFELPMNQQDRLRILRKLERLELSEAEQAERAGLSVEQVRAARVAATRCSPVGLDTPMARGSDGTVTLLDVLPAESPEEYAEVLDVQRAVECIDRLPDRQRMVLRLRYGLETGESMTFRQIGARLGGCSGELVRRDELAALLAVRQMLDCIPPTTTRSLAETRLLAYVKEHPGCTLGAASLAAGLDNRTARPMIERLGIELRRRPPGGRQGWALYALTGGAR